MLRHDRPASAIAAPDRPAADRHDPVTGLLDRPTFVSHLRRVAVGRHRWARCHLAVVVVDPDDFRVVNETAGFDVGDRVLAEIGRRLRAVVGPDGVLARISGDEFAVLAPVATPAAAEHMADRFVSVFVEPFRVDRISLTVAACAGVATTCQSSSDVLLRDAGLALHRAKREAEEETRTGRRTGWRRYRSADADVLDRHRIRADLGHAVRRDELALAYQPIVHLDSGRPIGVEALVRWRHPSRGLIPPDRFIGIAEDAGLMTAIGEQVLDLAVADAARWSRQLVDPVAVSVNVSAWQLRDPGFADRVLRRLTDAALPPQQLVLEITESRRLGDDDRGWADLGRLRGHGVRIAIDDFGTGYSSLSYLRHAPIDAIKLDRTFIRTVATCGRHHALVAGIVRLADALGLQTVAEGIEDRAQCAAVRAMGCRFGQGHLFAQAAGAAHIAQWLQEHSA